MLSGKHLIAGRWTGGDPTFSSAPADGESNEFAAGTAADVDAAVTAAEEAFWSYGYSSRKSRAAFLEAIAEEIEARGPEITAIGTAETGLPEARPDLKMVERPIGKAGVHPGVFSLIQSNGIEVGEALVKHPLIQAVGFTGSLRAGRAMRPCRG